MAKNRGADIPAPRAKTPPARPVALSVATPAAKGAAVEPAVRKRVSLSQFWQEVRTEGRKVTWTSWKETWITSVMVGIMVVITALFFLIVDGGLNFAVQQLLKLATG